MLLITLLFSEGVKKVDSLHENLSAVIATAFHLSTDAMERLTKL